MAKPEFPSGDSFRTLVVRLRGGDADAAKQLDGLFREGLQRFCLGYLRDVEEAEDCAQEILFKVLEAKEAPDRLRPWLFRIARNHCLNRLRSKQRRPDGEPLPSEMDVAASVTGQLSRLVRDEERRALTRALSSLDDGEREILRLRYAEGASRDEIAEILEIPASVVKSRLYETVRRLRGAFPDAGER